jgi:hypothetical protein
MLHLLVLMMMVVVLLLLLRLWLSGIVHHLV